MLTHFTVASSLPSAQWKIKYTWVDTAIKSVDVQNILAVRENKFTKGITMYVEGKEERKLRLQSRVNFLNKYEKP